MWSSLSRIQSAYFLNIGSGKVRREDSLCAESQLTSSCLCLLRVTAEVGLLLHLSLWLLVKAVGKSSTVLVLLTYFLCIGSCETRRKYAVCAAAEELPL